MYATPTRNGRLANWSTRLLAGEKTPNPAVTRLRCPLLAFFGTREPDVGTEADLELLKSCIQRQPSGPRSVETVMIRGADQMYSGEEEQVARTIATWADKQLLPDGRGEKDWHRNAGRLKVVRIYNQS